jgi:hypothetical protein
MADKAKMRKKQKGAGKRGGKEGGRAVKQNKKKQRNDAV